MCVLLSIAFPNLRYDLATPTNGTFESNIDQMCIIYQREKKEGGVCACVCEIFNTNLTHCAKYILSNRIRHHSQICS